MEIIFMLLLLSKGVSGLLLGQRLQETLLKDYSPDIAPQPNISVPVNVQFEFVLRSIVRFNVPDQTITVNLWLRFYWNDPALTWNAEYFGGVEELHFKPEQIWTPDILLYEQTDNERSFQLAYATTVYSDGSVVWFVPTVSSFTCTVDISYFPFDRQECNMTWGSWNYNGHTLDIFNKSNSILLDSYKPSSEWNVERNEVEKVVQYYSCCPQPYPTLVYTLGLKRLPLFYVVNVIVPCVLLTVLAVCTFILAPESGERVSMSVTVLLASTVYQLTISQAVPVQSRSLPIIGEYFIAISILLSIGILMSILAVNIYHVADSKPLPKSLHNLIFHWLARPLCLTVSEACCYRQKRLVQLRNTGTDDGEASRMTPGEYGQMELLGPDIGSPADLIKKEWVLAARVVDRTMIVLFVICAAAVHVIPYAPFLLSLSK